MRPHGRKATLALVVMVFCGMMTDAEAGDCWQLGRKGGRYCTSRLQAGVSQKDCCAQNPAGTSWSSREYPELNETDRGQLFYALVINEGVHCQPCKANCSSIKCGKGKKCRMSRGVPDCVCAPKCRALRIGRGPVCGTDNRTYRSYCRLLRRRCRKKRNLRLAYKGECKTSCASVNCAKKRFRCVLDQNRRPHCVPCMKPCYNRGNKPVCGVNGVTYKNQCQARRAACLNGAAIPIAYNGPCQPGLTCSQLRCGPGHECLLSPKTNTPRCAECRRRCKRRGVKKIKVCGSNNVTYRSWCHMMKDACATGLVIDVMHAGRCFPKRFSTGNTTAPFANLPFLNN